MLTIIHPSQTPPAIRIVMPTITADGEAMKMSWSMYTTTVGDGTTGTGQASGGDGIARGGTGISAGDGIRGTGQAGATTQAGAGEATTHHTGAAITEVITGTITTATTPTAMEDVDPDTTMELMLEEEIITQLSADQAAAIMAEVTPVIIAAGDQ
ncbi:hypothetical protein HYN48_08100 [Flavobacterium magnum]|uniref:Uncharacterized protein n=1 Tax=Flavobacterium magnum TaxID=2162713 RepID=A0A2S0REI4_9FLAO|nr:hypothetical protein HYN48_08100 [Flavobacterium magnum]